MPVPPVVDLPVETVAPLESQLPLDSSRLATPLMLEGSVARFDPVARAADLAATLPREWCGTYRGFPDGTEQLVLLSLSDVRAYGQMVDVRGAMDVGGLNTSVQGNLNAKSDQLSLLILNSIESSDLEFGGDFLGNQGFSLSGWQAPRLTHAGGRLQLQPVPCVEEIDVLEAVPVRGLW